MLDIHPATILWTVVNLLVLYAFFRKFLFGRVNEVLDKRAALVEEEITQAEQQRTQAQAMRANQQEQLAQARAQADELVGRARNRGEQEYARLLEQAKREVQSLREEARNQNQAERDQLLHNARQEIAALALLAASKVAGRELDTDADRDLVRRFLSEAGELE